MTKIREWDIADHLKSEKDVAEYLDAAFALGDAEYIPAALGAAARARGMLKTAKDTGLDRSALYRSLSKGGDPRYSTIDKIARTMGYRLSLVPC